MKHFFGKCCVVAMFHQTSHTFSLQSFFRHRIMTMAVLLVTLVSFSARIVVRNYDVAQSAKANGYNFNPFHESVKKPPVAKKIRALAASTLRTAPSVQKQARKSALPTHASLHLAFSPPQSFSHLSTQDLLSRSLALGHATPPDYCLLYSVLRI
jgi:hypothetical protein